MNWEEGLIDTNNLDKAIDRVTNAFPQVGTGSPFLEGLDGFEDKGNIDLLDRPQVRNEDGSISTVRSMSFEDDTGQQILIPTVVNGKVVSDEEAIEHYYKTGEYLGKFDTVAEANAYGEGLHTQQESFYMDKDNPFLSGLGEIKDINNTQVDTNVTTPYKFDIESFKPKVYEIETLNGKLGDREGSQYSGIAQLGINERTPILNQLNITDAQYKADVGLQKQVADVWFGNLASRLDRNGFEVNDINMWTAHNQGVEGLNQTLKGEVSPTVLANMRNQKGMTKTSTVEDYLTYYSDRFK